MALSTPNVTQLMIAAASQDGGNQIADQINLGAAISAASSHTIANVIVATNVSTTIDFASLVVGDKILILPAVAGNSMFVTCATAGTLPQAAVVGSLYVVLRVKTAPAASAVKF